MSKFCKERRELLKGTCTLAGASVVVALGGSVNNAFAMGGPEPGIPVAGDALAFTQGAMKGQAVKVSDVVLNAPPVLAVALDPATGKPRTNEGDTDNATVLLYRVAPDQIPADMMDGTVEGIVVYSAVCTHLGCILTDWNAKDKWFQCPCHDATFDPLKDGKNMTGPTSRDLPQIPVKAVGGKLVVSDVPTGYIGVKRG